jgi:hypothetical protein
MRKGRFSEEQMVAIIQEADRDPVAAVAKRHASASRRRLQGRAMSSACGSSRRRMAG